MAVVTPDLADVFEEAFERIGLEFRGGYDLKTVRRSLNLMLLEWQNRGLNLFTIDSGTLSLTAGTATYTMPEDTIDLIEHQLRTGTGTSQVDSSLGRISVSTYAQQSSKNTQGRPSQIFVQRLATGTTVTLWPVPDATTTYTLLYYRLQGIDGLSSGIGTSAAIPPRFVPAMVAGLAYYLSMKKAPQMSQALKMDYEGQYQLAADEDTDSSPVRFVPFDTMGF